MWVHLDLVQSLQWTTVTNMKPKGKAKSSLATWRALPQEMKTDIDSLLDSKEERVVFATEQGVQLMVESQSGQQYLKNMMKWRQVHLSRSKKQPRNSQSNPWRSKKSFGRPKLFKKTK